MKKFVRINKLTKEKEEYVGILGILKTIDDEPRLNKGSKKPYYRFTAEIETPNDTKTIGGQVYESLIPHLGAMPQVGDKMEFNCNITDLTVDKVNTRWGIGKIYNIENGVYKSNKLIDELTEYERVRKLNKLKIKESLLSKPNLEELIARNATSQDGWAAEMMKKGSCYQENPKKSDLKKENINRDSEVNTNLTNSQTLNSNNNSSHSLGSKIIFSLSFKDLLEHTYSSYAREFGERKLKKIIYKVGTSKKVEGFISESKFNRVPPHFDYIIQMLNEIPYFIFSRGQTLVVGAMLALQKWDEEVNMDNSILSEEELRQRALYLITESKSMFF